MKRTQKASATTTASKARKGAKSGKVAVPVISSPAIVRAPAIEPGRLENLPSFMQAFSATRAPIHRFGKRVMSYEQAVAALDYKVTKEPIARLEPILAALREGKLGHADLLRLAEDCELGETSLIDPDRPEKGTRFDGVKGIFNATTGKHLGTFTDGFTFHQPEETLELVRAAVDTVGAQWSSVAAIRGGAQLHAFATIDAEIKAPKRGDTVALAIGANDFFDGKGVFSLGLYGVVLTCTNGARRNEVKFSMRSKHCSRLADRVNAVRFEIGMKVQDAVEEMRGFVHRLDSQDMTRAEMDTFSLKLFGLDSEAQLREGDQQAAKQTREKVEAVRYLFRNGTGNVGQTRWDAYNAVTEFADWFGAFRNSANASVEENRFASMVNGGVAKLKARAEELLLN